MRQRGFLGRMVMGHEGSLAGGARGIDRLLGPFLIGALVLLALGVSLPVVEVERFWFFDDEVSILNAVVVLTGEGEIAIALIILAFSVLFPAAKLLVALHVWRWQPVTGSAYRPWLRRLDSLGKWSMLDVFVVALLVISIKANSLADARTEPGFYLFLASILASMVGLYRLRSIAMAATLNTSGTAAGSGTGPANGAD